MKRKIAHGPANVNNANEFVRRFEFVTNIL